MKLRIAPNVVKRVGLSEYVFYNLKQRFPTNFQKPDSNFDLHGTGVKQPVSFQALFVAYACSCLLRHDVTFFEVFRSLFGSHLS